MRKTVKKISVRLTQEQLDFLTLDGGIVSEGIKASIDLSIELKKSGLLDAKEDTINTSVGQITQTNTNNLIWE